MRVRVPSFRKLKGFVNHVKNRDLLGEGEGEGDRNCYFGGRAIMFRGSCNFEVKLKLDNTSIKSIFGITDLIYSRDI